MKWACDLLHDIVYSFLPNYFQYNLIIKRPSCNYKFLSNQKKKVAPIKKIIIAFWNILLSNYKQRGNKYI